MKLQHTHEILEIDEDDLEKVGVAPDHMTSHYVNQTRCIHFDPYNDAIFSIHWGERSEPPPSVADEGLVYIYRPVRTFTLDTRVWLKSWIARDQQDNRRQH